MRVRKRLGAALLVVCMVAAMLTGCGSTEKIIVAEKGSAGEKVASTLEGYTYTAVKDQAAALMEGSAGTADAASFLLSGTWRSGSHRRR